MPNKELVKEEVESATSSPVEVKERSEGTFKLELDHHGLELDEYDGALNFQILSAFYDSEGLTVILEADLHGHEL